MKAIFCFLLLLNFSPIEAQGSDSLEYRNGLVVELDRSFIRDVGYKYKFSPYWATCVKLEWTIDSNSPPDDYSSEESRSSIKFGVGVEYTFVRTEDISFLGIGFLACRFYRSKPDERSQPSGVTGAAYYAEIGVGVEYAISTQFSISASQSAGFLYSESRFSNPGVGVIRRAAYLDMAVAGLIFYF